MKNNFAVNFKALRLERKLRQIDVAKYLNTTQRKISYWEKGTIEPDLDSLLEISKFFDISVDELIGNE